jgi:hypothetical protein
VSDEVDLTGAIGIPKVDGQDIEGCIDFAADCQQTGTTENNVWGREKEVGCLLDIDLLFRLGISHDQSDTGWWRDRSPILCRACWSV